MEAPKPSFEDARIGVIHDLGLLSVDFERAFDNVVTLTKLATGLPICAFSIVDENRQFFKASKGLDVRETPRDVAFCAWAIIQESLSDVMIVEHPEADERFTDNNLVTGEFGLRFYAGIPVNAPNKLPVGTICIIDKETRQFTSEMDIALRCAKKLLEDALLLREQSIRDQVTTLFNRRYFDIAIDREWRRAYRSLTPIALLLIDIDYFKGYNDIYGHQAGDKLLAQVGDLIEAVVNRGGDTAARYGGDEFVIILTSTDKAGTEKVAQRLLDAVFNLDVVNSASRLEKMTVTIGGAVITDRESLSIGSKKFINLADEALYEAKNAGRNQVIIRKVEADCPQASA